MVGVCFYFQVHQPFRLRRYPVFDIGNNHNYFDEDKNRDICRKVADKCYLPANRLMLKLIEKHKGRFKVSFSITGCALEQFERYCPEVIESFKELYETGCVEFLSETYNHSLAFLYSEYEFRRQVELHSAKIKELFGASPRIFRNTELVYNTELARFVEAMGFEGILAEGADHILGWRSPNFVYTPKGCKKIGLLLKNYRLSDDIAFRFSNKSWDEYPLTVSKYAGWLDRINGSGDIVNLFMDYETFGEHQWEETGIFDFMERLPSVFLKSSKNEFLTLGEAIKKHKSKAELDVKTFMSWADIERDLSAWTGNEMQRNAINELYMLEKDILASGDRKLISDWSMLQTSDHFYYMCTKWFDDGDVHKYFNPYDSPYEAFIAFMNILNDLIVRIKGKEYAQVHRITEKPSELLKEAGN